jgi:hypothetical protein
MSNVNQTLETMESAVQQQDTPLTVTLQRKGGRSRAQSMPRAQVILANLLFQFIVYKPILIQRAF